MTTYEDLMEKIIKKCDNYLNYLGYVDADGKGRHSGVIGLGLSKMNQESQKKEQALKESKKKVRSGFLKGNQKSTQENFNGNLSKWNREFRLLDIEVTKYNDGAKDDLKEVDKKLKSVLLPESERKIFEKFLDNKKQLFINKKYSLSKGMELYFLMQHCHAYFSENDSLKTNDDVENNQKNNIEIENENEKFRRMLFISHYSTWLALVKKILVIEMRSYLVKERNSFFKSYCQNKEDHLNNRLTGFIQFYENPFLKEIIEEMRDSDLIKLFKMMGIVLLSLTVVGGICFFAINRYKTNSFFGVQGSGFINSVDEVLDDLEEIKMQELASNANIKN